MVEMARVELASESISKGISPSTAGVLVIRFILRPPAGLKIRYPVVPSCYRELTRGFPACLMPSLISAGEYEMARLTLW